ncbi:MAG: phosphatase PAP2 family protein [Thermoleophilia bacterium]|nr:phosphatase PAP2 family protein [Thermoleophilia bacterium]
MAVAFFAEWDRLASEWFEGIRSGPLTATFVFLSAWWVKSLLIAAVGGVGDIRARRRLPTCTTAAAVAVLLAGMGSGLLKELFERARPPLADASVSAAVSLPEGYSFPSGHATTAFAAAAAVSAFHPRLRLPLFGLAALVALSRVYLGVHFTTDVLVGAVLGTTIGLASAALTRRVVPRLRAARSAAREVAPRPIGGTSAADNGSAGLETALGGGRRRRPGPELT